MCSLQIITHPPLHLHLPLSPGSSAGFAPFVLDYLPIHLPNKGKLPLPCIRWAPGTKPFSSRSFATRKMYPIAAILTLLLPTAPIMSIVPTQPSPPLLPALRTRIAIRIACPILDPLIPHPLITLAPTPPPLGLTLTRTTPPIPGILPTQTTTQPTATLRPFRALVHTAPSSTVLSLVLPLIHLVPPNLVPRVSRRNARSL